MKVLVFGLSANMGGVESFIINYSNILLETHDDIKIDYVIVDKLPDCAEYFLECGCDFFIVPNRVPHVFEYQKKLYQIVKKGKYDCIWYNTCTLSDVTLLKIGKQLGVPNIIVHSHNSENMGNKLNMLLHEYHKKSIEKMATHFYACSDLAGEFMFTEMARNRATYKIVNNAIDLNSYKFDLEIRNKIREENGWSERKVIGHIGRFHKQKNHRFLIDIFKEMHEKDATTLLLLIGDGALKAEIEEYVKEKGLENAVCFLGTTKKVHNYLQAIDLFILPSLYEGLPMVLVEAQTAGVPCCVSDVVSKQAKLTDNIRFISLDDNTKQWAQQGFEMLLEAGKKGREQGYCKVKECGFDLKDNCDNIFDF